MSLALDSAVMIDESQLCIFSERCERAAWNLANEDRWRRLMLLPDLEQYDRITKCPFVGAGIYALFADGGRLLYIGKSNSVRKRLSGHYKEWAYRSGPEFDRYSCLSVPDVAYSDVEIAHIYALAPPLNKLYEPPAWPGHESMVLAIKHEWGRK